MQGQDKQVDNQSKGPGAARLEAERARIAKIKAKAAVPSKCGPDIISAPARGAFVATHRATMVPNGVDDRGLEKWSPARTGYGHRASVRAAVAAVMDSDYDTKQLAGKIMEILN